MALDTPAECLGQPDRALSDRARGLLAPLLVAAALGLGCFYRLGSVGLFDLDEGLYATVARQMVESGDWLVPRVGSEVFFDKPPMLYWLQALSIHVFGMTPLAVRLPSAVAVALTALLLGLWARWRGTPGAGWLVAAIYPLGLLSVGLARQAIMDALLALWLTLAVIGWIEGYHGDRRGYLLMAAGAGLATMTKGLIGLLLPGAAFVAWVLIQREWREPLRVPWAAAGALYLAIVLPWHLAVWHASGPLFVQEYVVQHHVQRFLGKQFGHHAPVWTYLPLLLVGMFPWSAFAAWGWWRSLAALGWLGLLRPTRCVRTPQRGAQRASRGHPSEARSSAASMWALWALVVFVFFSMSKSKLPGYIQPAVPALALLAAMRLDAVWQTRGGLTTAEKGITGVSAALLAGLFLAAGILGLGWRGQANALLGGRVVPAEVSVPLTDLAPVLVAIGAVILLGGVALLLAWRFTPRVAAAGAVTSLAVIGLLVQSALPTWSAYDIRPLHDLALRTLPDLRRGEPLMIYGFRHRRPSLLFVLGHTDRVRGTRDPAELQQAVRAAPAGSILAERKTSLPPLEATLRQQGVAGRWALWRWEATAPASQDKSFR